MLMPGLLKHELEVAMVSLGVIHDRTYAWDIFKDMLVSHGLTLAEFPTIFEVDQIFPISVLDC